MCSGRRDKLSRLTSVITNAASSSLFICSSVSSNLWTRSSARSDKLFTGMEAVRGRRFFVCFWGEMKEGKLGKVAMDMSGFRSSATERKCKEGCENGGEGGHYLLYVVLD